ncbi:YidH family protein [Pseudomonas putida]
MLIPRWRQQGTDPDYRFSLANERTFLAWIRTAMGLLAGGLVLDQFATRLGPNALVVSLAIAFGGLATLLCGLAYVRWRANEIAMRHGRPLPQSLVIPLIAATTLVIAGAVVGLWIVRVA